jgi:structural maintenance of chromosome 4
LEKYRQTLAEFVKNKTTVEEEMNQLMESLQDATKDLRSELEQEKFKLSEAEKSVSSLQSERDLIENGIKLVQSRAEGANKNIQALQEKLDTASEEKEKERTEFDQIVDFEKTIEEKMTTLRKSFLKLEREEQEMNESIRELVLTIETQKSSLANKQTGNKVVQALFQATKNRGPLSKAGIRGRLGDLASIAPEYDVAITTACGQLDFIVVETAEGAQQCVEYLRALNLGRASFIILTQMSEWIDRMNRPMTLPDGSSSPRLFDLLQDVAEDIRPAFYFALRDTLVASDLEKAVRIAYEGDRAKWRVVTVLGELIETSGAMSGGGNEIRKGGMKLVVATTTKSGKPTSSSTASKTAQALNNNKEEGEEVNEKVIQKNEEKIRELKEVLQTIRDQKKTVETEIKSLEGELKSKMAKKEKIQLSLKRFEESSKEMMKRIKSLEKETTLTAVEQQEITQRQLQLQELDNQIATTAPSLKTIQNRVTILQREILASGGMKLTKLQSKIDSFTQQIEMVSKGISTKEIEEANLLKSFEKLTQAIQKAENEIQKNQSKVNELEKEKAEMEADVKKMTALIESSREQLVSFEKVLVKKTEEYNSLKEKNNQLKSVELDLTMEQERLLQEKKEIDHLTNQWRKEWESMKRLYTNEKKELNQTISNIFQQNNLPVDESLFAVPAAAAGDRSELMMTEEDEEAEEVAAASNPLAMEELPVYSTEELKLVKIEEVKRQIGLLEAERTK